MNKTLNILTDNIKVKFTEILGNNLTGIYLHGSVAFGCFNWECSDIDFIAVVETEPDFDAKKKLIEFMLEMSMVLAKDCKRVVYPVPYCLHFSEYHKKAYEADICSHIEKLQGTDKDLAAHFTVINHCGITLCGKDKAEVFSPVPKEYYTDSIVFDVENAKDEIADNPVYIILNLCRVLAYIQDNKVLSKADCQKWSYEHLPQYYQLIKKATDCYIKAINMEYDNNTLVFYADDMLKKIYENL